MRSSLRWHEASKGWQGNDDIHSEPRLSRTNQHSVVAVALPRLNGDAVMDSQGSRPWLSAVSAPVLAVMLNLLLDAFHFRRDLGGFRLSNAELQVLRRDAHDA